LAELFLFRCNSVFAFGNNGRTLPIVVLSLLLVVFFAPFYDLLTFLHGVFYVR
jgi:hypothetical protein